jgi:enamine deaminase RidA (YjgF/YER057c/UK114 family)
MPPTSDSRTADGSREAALAKPFADYVHTRRAGDLIFDTGQGCRDPRTDEYAGVIYDENRQVSRYDAAAQTRGVLENVERALAAEGLTRGDIVDVTVFLCDMRDFTAMNQVWNDFFRDVAPPTRTTVAVTRLPGHNYVEMKAVAASSRLREEA